MERIRCPYCGSPARLWANRWECGYCGDSGPISSLPSLTQAQLNREVGIQLEITGVQFPQQSQSRQLTDGELEDMVHSQDFSENSQAAFALLLRAFPTAANQWSTEELEEMDIPDLLVETGEVAPETGVLMMQYLLDLEECHLQTPEAAQQILGWYLYDACLCEPMQPALLKALKASDRFAQQLFLSAYTGLPQEELINVCGQLGEHTLKEKLETYLAQNPYRE